MNNEENPSIQAPGQAVDNPTRIAALGSPEGSPPGPKLQVLARSLWHRPDCPDYMPRTHLPKWENLHAGPLVDMPVELVAALTTLAREIGPGAFRVTFSFEAR